MTPRFELTPVILKEHFTSPIHCEYKPGKYRPSQDIQFLQYSQDIELRMYTVCSLTYSSIKMFGEVF